MRIIARIPDISVTAETSGPSIEGTPTPRRHVPRPQHRDGLLARVADACPTWPMAGLAVIAVVVWLAASWNDHARLQRQRSEVRLAREPIVTPAAAPAAPAAGGAVIR